MTLGALTVTGPPLSISTVVAFFTVTPLGTLNQQCACLPVVEHLRAVRQADHRHIWPRLSAWPCVVV